MSGSLGTHQIARGIFLLSGFSIWYLSFLVCTYAPFGVYKLGAGTPSLIIIGGGIIAQFFLGIAFSRVLCRISPLSLNETSRPTKLVIVPVVLAIYCVGLVVAWRKVAQDAAQDVLPIRPRDPLPLIPMEDPVMILVSILFLAVWVLTVATTFLHHKLHLASMLNSPFTLFLRRFSTTSDRSVAHAVMNVNLAVRPIALLVPQRSEPEDWNPTTVFMAGLQLLGPIRSLPYFFQAPDESWVDAVRKLIMHAEIIVIDGSNVSDAIAEELRLIDELRMWSKTILLLDRKLQATYSVATEGQPLTVIYYNCTWKAGLPRLLLGIVLVIPVGIPITVPYVFVMMWLIPKIGTGTVILELTAALVPFFFSGLALQAVVR